MDDFHERELEKALSEQRYGIDAYRVDREACTSHVAVAVVDLLEGRQLRVKLSNLGYEVVKSEGAVCAGVDSDSSRVYETLEDLLLDHSVMYGKRRADEIIARLSRLNNRSF